MSQRRDSNSSDDDDSGSTNSSIQLQSQKEENVELDLSQEEYRNALQVYTSDKGVMELVSRVKEYAIVLSIITQKTKII